jgi:hypothetical protein
MFDFDIAAECDIVRDENVDCALTDQGVVVVMSFPTYPTSEMSHHRRLPLERIQGVVCMGTTQHVQIVPDSTGERIVLSIVQAKDSTVHPLVDVSPLHYPPCATNPPSLLIGGEVKTLTTVDPTMNGTWILDL